MHRDVTQAGFTDVQAAGPAKKWEHTHSFTEISENLTLVKEHIEFEHRGGFWGIVTRILFCRPSLLFMFWYRKRATIHWLKRHPNDNADV